MRRAAALLLVASCTSFDPDPQCQTSVKGVDALLLEGRPGVAKLGRTLMTGRKGLPNRAVRLLALVVGRYQKLIV